MHQNKHTYIKLHFRLETIFDYLHLYEIIEK